MNFIIINDLGTNIEVTPRLYDLYKRICDLDLTIMGIGDFHKPRGIRYILGELDYSDLQEELEIIDRDLEALSLPEIEMLRKIEFEIV